METSNINKKIGLDQSKKKIVLVGNPNVGKSLFFNYLTNTYVTVSNYPGTTLDISTGKYKDYIVLDTPGVYGVSSFNDEELVARDIILSADIIINVVDAVHLERDLFLTQQLLDMGKKIIVALNLMDEAKDRGLDIDIELLEKKLKVKVIPTIATEKFNFKKIEEYIAKAKRGQDSLKDKFEKELLEINKDIDNRAAALLILEGDKNIALLHNTKEQNLREDIYKSRREYVDSIVKEVVTKNETKNSFSDFVGSLILKPLTGIPILFIILYLLYQFIGVFVAQTLVGYTEELIMIKYYQPFIIDLVGNFVNVQSILGKILVGEFGVLTMTTTYIIGLLLPLVAGFYFFLSILEDSGYMPRIAALVDRGLNYIGLNGRAIIPMLLGFGCVTMATVTTRLLGSKREKIIAIFLLGLAIPCSAQLGVIAGLIAPLGFKFFMIYIITIFAVYAISGTFLNKVLPGESTDLLIDLPPVRMPKILNVLNKTYLKSKYFIFEAGPIFALGAVVITLMKELNILEKIQNTVAPLIIGWLKLPKEATDAFIMGIIRRDFGAAGLYSLSLTNEQTLVSLIVITLFVPCIAAMLVMIKEQGIKQALIVWLGSWFAAFTVGGIVAFFMI
ncbi:MAG: ferrous iron transport protein B [Halanaerobiales bacterium]|nr:ferrous iron transport protein B [Halanaerobiales bacterium]